MFRLAFGIQQHASWGVVFCRSRQALALLGIVLLGALALSTSARRPYVSKSTPAAHTSKASVMTEVHQEIAPLPQPTSISTLLILPPSINSSCPTREEVFPQPPGFFCSRALRSPPFV